MVGLQLLRYMVRFWERQVKDNGPMRPIIPLVIYHGEKAWRSSTDFLALLDAPEGLRPYLPDFRYHLTDFSYLSDETIRGRIWLLVSFPRSTWERPPERSACTRRRASWKLIPRRAWNEGG